MQQMIVTLRFPDADKVIHCYGCTACARRYSPADGYFDAPLQENPIYNSRHRCEYHDPERPAMLLEASEPEAYRWACPGQNCGRTAPFVVAEE